jgi:hypothetical protein
MTPTVVTSIEQLTCEHCIWAHNKDEHGVNCGNVTPQDEIYHDKDSNSFCRDGQWLIYNQKNKQHLVSGRIWALYMIMFPDENTDYWA